MDFNILPTLLPTPTLSVVNDLEHYQEVVYDIVNYTTANDLE